MDYCRTTLLGRLTADPEIRYTQTGTPVANFSLAVNRKCRQGDGGELTEAVTFIPIRVFGKAAENAGQYLGKGRPILVDGEIRSSEWTDKEGVSRRMLYVAAQRVIYLGKGNGQQETQPEPATAEDGDIPF